MLKNVAAKSQFSCLLPKAKTKFSDGKRKYKSVEEYCKYQTLVDFNQKEAVDALANKLGLKKALRIHESILYKVALAAGVLRRLNLEFRRGRLLYLEAAYLFRFSQDKKFRKSLLATNGRRIVFCDSVKGRRFPAAKRWQQSRRTVGKWYFVPPSCRQPVTGTVLSKLLMRIRDKFLMGELSQLKLVNRWMVEKNYDVPPEYWEYNSSVVEGFTVSQRLVVLAGVFLPLSCCYRCHLTINGRRYHSVVHYALVNLLRLRRVDARAEQELFKVEEWPSFASKVERYLCKTGGLSLSKEEKRLLVYWLDVAVVCRFERAPCLKTLLLSTGDALLVESLVGIGRLPVSCGLGEGEMMALLCRQKITTAALLNWMLHPLKIPQRYKPIFGSNFAGLTLMRYRKYLQKTDLSAGEATCSTLDSSSAQAALTADDVPSLVPPFVIANIAPFREDIAKFGFGTPLHPAFFSPIVCPERKFPYPSAYHMTFMEGCKFLGFPYQSQMTLAKEPPERVFTAFQKLVGRYFPDESLLTTWNSTTFYHHLKLACRLKFVQHPALMSALLETGERVLVYCHRCSFGAPELAVGMNASDFDKWMNLCSLDSAKLIGLCIQPYGRRLPDLGGNRLGVLLMELRRDFFLEGYDKESSDDNALPPAILDLFPSGKDEAFCEDEGFLTLWPNPLLNLTKLKNYWCFPTESQLPLSISAMLELSPKFRRENFNGRIALIRKTVKALQALDASSEKLKSICRSHFQQISDKMTDMIVESKGLTRRVTLKDRERKENEPDSKYGYIPKLHMDPIVNKQVILLEAGFIDALKSTSFGQGTLQNIDWTSAGMKEAAAKTWYHLTDVELSKALDWLRHSVELLRDRMDRKKLFDERHFVSGVRRNEMRWHDVFLNNLSVNLLDTKEWTNPEVENILNIQLIRRPRSQD